MSRNHLNLMPLPVKNILIGCIAVSILSLVILILKITYHEYYDIPMENNGISIMRYGVVFIISLCLFLVIMSSTFFFKNMQQRQKGDDTYYSINKHGASDGGSYIFNQLINLFYMGGAGWFIYFLCTQTNVFTF